MSEAAQRTAERVVAAMLERDAFSRWLGVELRSVSPGRCVLTMAVREDMVNGFGAGGEGHLRLSYAASPADLALAVERLTAGLAPHGRRG